jgi:hypothetical protein
MNYSVFKIPCHPVTKKYFEKRFANRVDERGYMHMDKNSPFGMKIIHYLDNWWPSWELPVVTGIFLKVTLPKVYAKYGIEMRKLKELTRVLDAEAMEYLVMEIACASQYPGVSVTEAIITVMSRYDISDEEYRSDSMRRHFDRYCEDVAGTPFKEFSHTINASMKKIYERMVLKGKTFEDLIEQ